MTNGCSRCSETPGFIASPKLGRVRCPYCRPQSVERVSPKNMRVMLTAIEARRREQTAIAAGVVLDDFKFPDVPNHLLTTQRVLERWGYDGSGLESEYRDEFRVAKPPPLDPGTYTAVEQRINTAPDRVRRFVYDWYRSSNPGYVTEVRRGMSRRQVGRMRIDTLHAMKARFLTSGHGDLVALIRFVGE